MSAVEWKELGKLVKRNKGISITAGQMSELNTYNGNVRVFAAGQTIADINEDKLPHNCAYKLPSIIVKSRGYIDFEFYDKPFTHKNEMWSYSFTNKDLGKFIYYYLTTKTDYFRNKAKANSVKLPQLCVADTDNYLIPIPSLAKQQEIVSHLDTFTTLISNLESELDMRRKQYEHYRNQLLDFEGVEGVEWKSLRECIDRLKTGLNPRKNFVLNEPENTIPYVTGKEIKNNKININNNTDRINAEALELINKRALLEKGLLLFASTGCSTVGRMAIIEEYQNDWGISETLYAIKINSNINTYYVRDYLNTLYAKRQYEPYISKGSVPHLKISDLLNVIIPIPSTQTQQEIVEKLDAFEQLIQSLEQEIKLRKQQYEYYREKLLTFEKE